MKKFFIILSYITVAVISGGTSIIGYNTLLKANVIKNFEQLEIRKRELLLEYNKRQLKLEAQERVNSLAHRQKMNDVQQREREIELENHKASRAFTQ